MSSVVSKAFDLIGATQSRELERRRAAGQSLREILRRNAEPREGDEESLIEAMAVLGLAAGSLPATLELLTNLDNYESTVDRKQEIGAAYVAASRAIQAIEDWAKQEHERIDREKAEKMIPARRQSDRAHAQQDKLRDAEHWFNETQAKWLVIVEGISLQDARAAIRPIANRPFGSLSQTERADLQDRISQARKAADEEKARAAADRPA